MRRVVVLVLVVACDKPPAPVASVQPVVERGDSCQHDIPDCEAACALREVHRTEHLDWFDRRCAAVVLGKNPDKAVGYEPPEAAPIDASSATAAPSCDPPYVLEPDGRKTWKRQCL
jgi:hypothetical protein